MLRPFHIILSTLCLLAFTAGCITAIDPSLPHQEMPTLTVATNITLVASPAHPTAYLTQMPVAAGTVVTLLGTTQDMSWLLVLNGRIIGWIPTFFVRDNISTVTPAFTFTPPAGQCTLYLDVTSAPDEPWLSTVDGALRIVGVVYRPTAQPRFTDSTLSVTIDGAGQAVDADYVHAVLTPTSSLIFFTYNLSSLQKGSRISFSLENVAPESVIFEAAYFSDSCAETARYTKQLPIGMPRGISIQVTTPPTVEPSATPSPRSTGIVSRSDARTPTLTPTLTPIPTLDRAVYGELVKIERVTASSQFWAGNPDANNVVDGNITSTWSSSTNDDIGAWLQLHLAEPSMITGIRIYVAGQAGPLGQPENVSLTFSNGSQQQIHLDNIKGWHYHQLAPTVTEHVKLIIESVYSGNLFGNTKLYEVQLFGKPPPPPKIIETNSSVASIQLYSDFFTADAQSNGRVRLHLLGQDRDALTQVTAAIFSLEKDVAGDWIRMDGTQSNHPLDESGRYTITLLPQQYLLTLDVSNVTGEPIVPGWYSDENYSVPDKVQYRGIIFPVEAGKTTDIEVHFSRLVVGVLDEAGRAVSGDAHPGWTVAVCADALHDVADETLRCAGQAIDRRGGAAFQLAPGNYQLRVTTDTACYWEFPVTVGIREVKEELITIERSEPDGCVEAGQ